VSCFSTNNSKKARCARPERAGLEKMNAALSCKSSKSKARAFWIISVCLLGE